MLDSSEYGSIPSFHISDQGNVHQVEVRGEKTKDGIRFSWSDISRLFEMPATYHLSQKLDQQNMGVYQASTYLTYEECWIDPNMIYSVRPVSYNV